MDARLTSGLSFGRRGKIVYTTVRDSSWKIGSSVFFGSTFFSKLDRNSFFWLLKLVHGTSILPYVKL